MTINKARTTNFTDLSTSLTVGLMFNRPSKRTQPPQRSLETKPREKFLPKEVLFFNTVGYGNCFFHASFGKASKLNSAYYTNEASDMRKEWHNLLAQFNSLSDPKMPETLKKFLEPIFLSLLDAPGHLDKSMNGLPVDNVKNN